MKYLQSKFTQIKAFIIKRLVPDYDKLKLENKELKEDIYNIVMKEHELSGLMAKMKHEHKFEASEYFLVGSRKFLDAFKQEALKACGIPKDAFGSGSEKPETNRKH